jgi:hypothetical protein
MAPCCATEAVHVPVPVGAGSAVTLADRPTTLEHVAVHDEDGAVLPHEVMQTLSLYTETAGGEQMFCAAPHAQAQVTAGDVGSALPSKASLPYVPAHAGGLGAGGPPP